MKINLSRFEETQVARKGLFERLKLPKDVRLDLAFDAVHALNELTRSLADLHPHKRSVAILGAQPSPIAEIAVQFASQGFNVQHIPVSFTHYDEAGLQTAWAALKKDTLFVLTSVVEPLTGALYPVEWLRSEAIKKNIFTLLYQSPDSLGRGLITPQNAFEGICADPLWGQTSALTLLIKGERCGGEKLLWGEPRFEIEAIKSLEKSLLNSLDSKGEDKEIVLAFENKLKAKLGASVHFLGEDTERLYDRAVVFTEGASGDSLIYELSKSKIEAFTGAACAWDNPNLNSWLPQLGISQDWVQTSLILPLAEVKKATTLNILVESVTALRKISGL
jgi:cysteine sulfinate desulfinase/cysteine desulfurase-like protein